MVYTWQDIQQDWLVGGNDLAIAPDEAVAAFNTVAAKFGRNWIESSRIEHGSVVRGTSPTLHIITLGLLLDALDDAPNTEHLLAKVRDEKPDARAELVAIYLLCSGSPEISVEVEPEVTVGRRNRKPDFRTRSADDSWVYVEVTQTTRNSPAQKDIRRGMDRLSHLVNDCTGSFALEVFLKRDASDEELDYIEEKIKEQHEHAGQIEIELPSGLGTLYWNHHPPGTVVLDDHGETYTPRLGSTGAAMGDGYHRHILVRWPFTDMRAEAILTAEAKQLPTDAAGVVMIQTSGAVGAMNAWRTLIQRRLQPTMHTRVSAVCLFTSAIRASENGEVWRPECKIILNPHARFPLPSWIAQQLERFPSDATDMPAA